MLMCINDIDNFFAIYHYSFSNIYYICQIVSRQNNKIMLFTEFIRQSREHLQLPQRKLAEALDIDTATYCKIEKGERRVKREQIRIVAEVLNVNELELRTLWLADQVVEIIENEQEISDNVLDLVKENVKK